GARHLAEVWKVVHRHDVFPIRPLAGLLGFVGARNYLVPPAHLRALLAQHLTYHRIEEAPVRLLVVATELGTGIEVLLGHGDVIDAVAASAAIPGIFPPVGIGQHVLVDGGLLNNTPLSHAIEAGATRVYVLPTGYACALERPPRSALGITMQSITLMLHRRLLADVAAYQHDIDLKVLPPLCPLSVSAVDFNHTSELIDRARLSTAEWLDRREPVLDQTEVLLLHRHDSVELMAGRSGRKVARDARQPR
ncbi:MAG: patatin-like phospholipase family protein, partial [Acidimicrobiales bacterium]